MSVLIAPPPQSRPTGVYARGTASEQPANALDAARGAVQRLLTAIPTFPDLSDEERARMAKATVQVLSFMADPNGVYSEVADREARGELPTGTLPVEMAAPGSVPARALDDAVEQTKQSLSSSPGFAGKDFEAGAVKQGVQQFGEMVQKVDFPKFVGGLIKNVFQAIVESSIDQMRAYGELISNVAKTTDQFMRDNIGEAAGRDFLVDSYPDVFQIESGSTSDSFEGTDAPDTAGTPTLGTVSEEAIARIAEISRNMNVNPPVSDISDPNAELRLVTGARLQMAKSRQQLLSSMVMLGINRIVVTDGSINAKVIFDMRSSDKAKRQYTASMNDRSATALKNTAKMEYGSWFSPVSAEMTNEFSTEHVATVASAVDETSESKAEAKAKLSGEVRVNFKSDYLPLDKMATPGMMSVIQGNSTPYNPNQPDSGAAGTRAG